MPSKQPEPLGKKVGQSETEVGRIHEEYKRSNFYIASIDKHHNNERLKLNDKNTIRVPTFVWAQVTKWVEEEITPYRTAADFIRDAIMHRLHDLQDMAEREPDAQWRGMRLQAEMKRRTSDADRYKAAVSDIREMTTMAWTDGDMGLYRSLVNDAEKLAQEIPSPYKESLVSFLNEQQNLRRLNTSE